MVEINVNFNEVSHKNGKIFNYSNDITIIKKIITKIIIYKLFLSYFVGEVSDTDEYCFISRFAPILKLLRQIYLTFSV